MAASSRSTLLTRTHRVLKKQFKPVSPDADRGVLEHMIYACCLRDADYVAADKAFETLRSDFFDWNEVRVSTVKELAEAIGHLPDPVAAASSLKSILQQVFEKHYAFDLELLRKENLGKATKYLAGIRGTDPFIVAYTVQSALGGHSIPVNGGAMRTLELLGIVTAGEAASGNVPGMERAIAKKKGAEFGSLLHQLGVKFAANPYSTTLHRLMAEINPEAKQRLPKRPAKKTAGAARRSTTRGKTKGARAGSKAAKATRGAKKAAKQRAAKKSGAKKITKRKPR